VWCNIECFFCNVFKNLVHRKNKRAEPPELLCFAIISETLKIEIRQKTLGNYLRFTRQR